MVFNNSILLGAAAAQGGGGFYPQTIEQSLKFNDDESQYLSWTPATTGNRKTWTWSGWVKRGNLSTSQIFFGVHDGGSQQCWLGWNSGDTIQFFSYQGSAIANVTTQAVFRDVSAWYHLVVAFDAANTTMNMYVNGVDQTLTFYTAISNTDHNINSSSYVHGLGRAGVLTGNDADMYLADVYFIDGQALDASSFGQFKEGVWVATSYSGTYGTNGFHLTFQDDVVSEGFNTVTYTGNGYTTTNTQSISGLGFEPDFVWVKNRNGTGSHTLFDSVRSAGKSLRSDTTDAESTQSDSLTSFDSDGFSLGDNSESGAHTNVNNSTYAAWCWDAGANNAPTGHSSVTYTGNGGTQSIKGLGFEPDLVWIKSRSGVTNHILNDSIRGGNKTLFPNDTLAEYTDRGVSTFDADGFTFATYNGDTNMSGQSYVAWGWDAGNGSPVSNTDGSITSTVKASQANGFSIGTFTKGSGTETFGHGLSSAPELLIVKRRNGTGSWFSYSSVTGADKWIRLNGTDAATTDSTFWNNTAPTSSVATISTAYNSGEQLMFYAWNSVAGYSSIGSYTGNGSTSGPTITTGFRPGFVMVKRTDTTGDWIIQDTTRAPLGTIDVRLFANDISAEVSNGNGNMTVDGTSFTITNAHSSMNASGGTYIYIAFKGSYSDYVSNVNTDGTIESRVKANPSYGFSMVSWTGNATSGATIGHGLSSTPEMIINKNRIDNSGWGVYHSALGATKYIWLQEANAAATYSDAWNDTSPTSSVFTVGNDGQWNGSGDGMISYCFHSVAGYSSFGSYTGTGAAGNTITTGFPVAFVMIKATSISGEAWWMFDNTRSTTDPRTKHLRANTNGAESTDASAALDFTSTGFEHQSSQDGLNKSGTTYIYMAFADTRQAAFWKDVSGNNNNWTPNNLDYRDSLPDSPTNNFATFNSIHTDNTITLSEGNLKIVHGYDSGVGTTFGFNPSDATGYYAEFYKITGTYGEIGIAPTNISDLSKPSASGKNGYMLYLSSGQKANNGSYTTYGSAVAAGDIVSVAVKDGKIWWGVNGVWIAGGDPENGTNPAFSGISGEYFFIQAYDTNVGTGLQTIANFGQDSTFAGAEPIGAYTDDNGKGLFQYAVPSGFLSLCSDNLPEVTVGPNSAAKPIDQFETILYTGNGGTQHIGSGGVQHPVDVTTIANSLRFNDDDSAYLARTPASSGNRKTWTWSGWVKRGNLTGADQFILSGNNGSTNFSSFYFNNSNNLAYYDYVSGNVNSATTSAVFKDASAWYHIVLYYDTTQATSTDRIKIYVNGEQQSVSASYPSLNYDSFINLSSYTNYLASQTGGASYLDGYLSDVHFIDGQALDPTSFGQYGVNGYWIPKAVTGLTYGTNGFSLDFSDNSTATALGTDGSGNSNDWTPANLGVSDQMLDSPTQNYAVLNPLDLSGSQAVLKEGNLQFTKSTATGYYNTVTGTFGVLSGKWYWEIYTTSSADAVVGVTTNRSVNAAVVGGSTSTSWVYQNYDGQKRTNNISSAYGATWTTGDIIGVALDMDSGTLEFYKNGTSQGQAFTGITGTAFPGIQDAGNTLTSMIINFGADSTFAGAITAGGNTDANGEGDFAYAPPSGYLALNNNNIPEERGINSPDLVWLKSRNAARSHGLFDTVRGRAKGFAVETTNSEYSSSESRDLVSFDYDGFTVGTPENFGSTNTSGDSIVAWNWKAGGTAVANTDGSIASQVSANTNAGFSIVSYTGSGANATVGHGLNSAPQMIIVKARSFGPSAWSVYTAATGAGDELLLNSTAASTASANTWNNTAPTSSVFTVGTAASTNLNAATYIAYCFADVEGFSKVGSYTGNGSSDGPFVYTGFRPSLILGKCSSDGSSASDWWIYDSVRDEFNDSLSYILSPNRDIAEAASPSHVFDLVSNGFKIRSTSTSTFSNGSGQTYIYLAFAEHPFKYANAR